MKGYPSVRDPGSIEQLFVKIASAAAPAVVDREYLGSLGFRREADGALLELLGFLGFIDDAGAPTEIWPGTSGAGGESGVLGRAVLAAYADLFAAVPDAPAADGTLLMDFFRRATGASDPEAAYMVLTLKVLSDISEFPEEEAPQPVPVPQPGPVLEAEPAAAPVETPEPGTRPRLEASMEGPVIRLSIHIDISGDTDPQIRELAHRLLRRQLEGGDGGN